jgi:phosphatidate cytidylyltransferase
VLKQRLISGTILAGVAVGVLFVDNLFAPYFPILFVVSLLLGWFCTRELISMMPAATRPAIGFTRVLVLIVIMSNWYQPIAGVLKLPAASSEWTAPMFCLVLTAMAVIIYEMIHYQGPGGHIERMAMTMFAIVYLSLLDCFFIQLRWILIDHGSMILMLTIFVPKLGDTGAYAVGNLIGKHKMTPILSPKKTWEGFAGGLIGSLIAVMIFYPWAPFKYGIIDAILYGIAMSIAGILGDLAESLIKRDAGVKDAGKTIPGFGGMLDVVDAVLFAAPVSYLWFAVTHVARISSP